MDGTLVTTCISSPLLYVFNLFVMHSMTEIELLGMANLGKKGKLMM